MDSLSQPRWGHTLRALIAEHGWTALFVSATLVLARVDSASLELQSFRDRVVSMATAEALDIAARNSLFTTSIVLAPALFIGLLFALRWLRRATASGTNEVLEALSVGGCVALLARAWALPYAALVTLFSAALAFALLASMLDRWLLRARDVPERAEWTAVIGIAAIGLGSLLHGRIDTGRMRSHEWLLEAGLLAGALALHVMARLVCWRRTPGARDAACARFASACAPLAWLPLAWVLSEELYLTANNRGWMAPTPQHFEFGLLALLALWCLWRWRPRATPPSLQQALARVALPGLLVAATCYTKYRPLLGPHTDLFEPANPALFIQQWVDFGRVPFVETFNAHTLSDSLFGFVYAALHGGEPSAWRSYDFLGDVLGTLVTYLLARRLTSSAFIGAFVAGWMPMRTELFPEFCDMSLGIVLMLAWLLRAPSAGRWVLFALASAALFLWRLDMGFASLLASGGCALAWGLTRSDFRPKLSHIVLAGSIATVLFGGAFFALAYARGVDPFARLEDLRHILQSNQGFGHPRIAAKFTANVLTNLSVVPLALVALLIATLWRVRTRPANETGFRELFIVWAVAYYVANFPRGLVRHSWLEVGNVFALSLGLAAFGAGVLVWFRGAFHQRAAAFLIVTSVLAGVFGVRGPLPDKADHFHKLWSEVRARFITAHRMEHSDKAIDRSPTTPQAEEKHYAQFREFVAAHLDADQTFLDLQNTPMLFGDTRRRSPHYLNHLYLAHDEHLQLSEIKEFERCDIPLALVWSEADLAKRDGVEANRHNVSDALFNHVRQWRLHEWLNARYEPWRIVQRWQVWRRKDWMSPQPPKGEDELLLARAASGPDAQGRLVLAAASGSEFELAPAKTAYLRLRGRAPTSGKIAVNVEFAGEIQPLSRTLATPSGEFDLSWTLPPDTVARTVRRIEVALDGAPGLEAREAELLELTAPEYVDILPRATRWQPLIMRWLPWIWGTYDEAQLHLRPSLRDIWPPLAQLEQAASFTPAARNERGFVNGVHTEQPTILIDDSAPKLAVGDRVRFAHSGERIVARRLAGQVFFRGPPLDPQRDGHPHSATLMRLARGSGKSNQVRFQPLDDPHVSSFLVLEIVAPPRRGQGEPASGALQWGRDEANLGRIDFHLKPGLHTYVLPMANHYNFTRTAVNWFAFHGSAPGTECASMRLVAD